VAKVRKGRRELCVLNFSWRPSNVNAGLHWRLQRVVGGKDILALRIFGLLGRQQVQRPLDPQRYIVHQFLLLKLKGLALPARATGATPVATASQGRAIVRRLHGLVGRGHGSIFETKCCMHARQ
jgi:hypothetical protein